MQEHGRIVANENPHSRMFYALYLINKYFISPNKRRATNKRHLPISAAPLPLKLE